MIQNDRPPLTTTGGGAHLLPRCIEYLHTPLKKIDFLLVVRGLFLFNH